MSYVVARDHERPDWDDAATLTTLPQGHRRLAAIMFADMVGYTALMHRDERDAYAARSRYRRHLAKNAARYGGEIVQHYGDGALLLFHSAIDATRAARRLQRELRQAPQVAIRVGVHTADVVRDDDGVYGTGVNVASRLQALCPPGGVLVSGGVNYEMENKQGLDSVSLGYFRLKNLEHPVEVCAIVDPSLVVPTPCDIDAPYVPRASSSPGVRPTPRQRFSTFLTELKRRKVHHIAQAYAAFSVACLGGLSLMLPRLGLAETVPAWAITGVVVGAPIALGLSWMYDLSISVTAEKPPVVGMRSCDDTPADSLG